MTLEILFVGLLAFQTLHMALQDWLPLPPLNDVKSMAANSPRRTRLLVTLGNTLPSVIALVLAVVYLGQRKPLGVGIYYGLYFGLLLVLMWLSWYKPYLFGATEAETSQYEIEYGNTHHLLPARGDHPRPNTLHLVLHAVFLINAVLAVLIGFNLV